MGKKVLVVDDDWTIRDLLKLVLESAGYDVILAEDGLDAIERLDTTRPAVILLDLMMPRMDGAAFVRELHRRGLRQSIPIIVLSAADRGLQKAFQIGADGFVGKPFELPALLDEVARLASERCRSDASPLPAGAAE